MVEITPLPTDLNHSLIQLGHGIQYAWCSEDNKQATQWVYCKDYLQDAVWSFVNKNNLGTPDNPAIYGFHYDIEKNPPLDLNKTRLLIELPDKPNNPDLMLDLLSFLQQAENDLKVTPLTQVFQTNLPRTILLVGSPLWMRSTVTVSLYALLIRIGCSYAKTEESWKELLKKITTSEVPVLVSSDIQSTKNLISILPTLQEGLESVFGASMEDNMKALSHKFIHSCSGVQWYSTKNPEMVKMFSHWKFPGVKAKADYGDDYYEDDE